MKYQVWYEHRSNEYSKTLWHAESLVRREALITTCRKPRLYRHKTSEGNIMYYLTKRSLIKDVEGRNCFACIMLAN